MRGSLGDQVIGFENFDSDTVIAFLQTIVLFNNNTNKLHISSSHRSVVL